MAGGPVYRGPDATRQPQAVTVDWFWAAAEKAELPVMCFAPGGTSAFGRVAERYPQLQLILDHMGTGAAMVRDNTVAQAIGVFLCPLWAQRKVVASIREFPLIIADICLDFET